MEAALKNQSSQANLPSIQAELNLYVKIRATIDGLLGILKDLNTLSPEVHQQNGFKDIVFALRDWLKEN